MLSKRSLEECCECKVAAAGAWVLQGFIAFSFSLIFIGAVALAVFVPSAAVLGIILAIVATIFFFATFIASIIIVLKCFCNKDNVRSHVEKKIKKGAYVMSHKHHKIDPVCPVESMTQPPLSSESVTPSPVEINFIKVPVVLVEPKIQIVVEADIPLDPPAFEIKRVGKDVFLTQCKLVPVEFVEACGGSGDRHVTKAKLFVGGFIRKNIEYAAKDCKGVIQDRIADVPFSGFTEISSSCITEIGGATSFLNLPILNGSSSSSSRFINPKDGITPRQDKYFFENSVFYNEQPYCELVKADFYEIDFSPCPKDAHETFDKLREKIVLDLTVKVLQLQQVQVGKRKDKC